MKNDLCVLVIVTFNGERYITTCLESLLNQSYKNFKVVLVDNNSKDRTVFLAQKIFPELILIKNNKNLGFAKANNQGIKKGIELEAEYFVLLNQDTKVEPNFLEAGIKVLENENDIGLASPIILYKNTDLIWWQGSKIPRGKDILKYKSTKIGFHLRKKEKLKKESLCITFSDWIPGCSLFFKKEIIDKIGFLDETFFMYGEDVDFSLKVREKGYKLICFPETIVYHDEPLTKPKVISIRTFKKASRMIKARLKLVWRYFTPQEKLYYFLKCLTLPFKYVRK